MRRTLALWLLLFGVYAATLGLDAFAGSDYGGDEPHYLLAAHSIVQDGDVDVLDEYRERAYASFYPHELRPHGRETGGRLNEPHGVGFPLLIAPAYALGGAKAVELFLAALAALAVALAYRLALRVAPDPWALGAALAVGLSPPLLAYGTAVYPELAAAAALAGAALLACGSTRACRARGDAVLPSARRAALARHEVPGRGRGGGRVRGAAIWQGAAADARRRRRGGVAVLRGALRGDQRGRSTAGPTPYAADVAGETATDASFPAGYLERAYRLVALFVDRDYGLLRWAPVFALAFAGLWLLWRSHRDRLARAVPGCARSSSPRASAPRRSARSCWSRRSSLRRCSASGSRRATCWPRCRSRCRSWRGGCATRRASASCSRP